MKQLFSKTRAQKPWFLCTGVAGRGGRRSACGVRRFMSSSRSVSSRTAALALALTLGALPLASAEAAQGNRRASEIRQAPTPRTILVALTGWLLPGKHHIPGNKPGTSEVRPEGSGVCPNGKPGLQGNPNQTGN